jgi:hypothetical protein
MPYRAAFEFASFPQLVLYYRRYVLAEAEYGIIGRLYPHGPALGSGQR